MSLQNQYQVIESSLNIPTVEAHMAQVRAITKWGCDLAKLFSGGGQYAESVDKHYFFCSVSSSLFGIAALFSIGGLL